MIIYSSSFRLSAVLTALLLCSTACTPTANTAIDTDAKVRVDDRMTTDISPTDVFTKNSIGSTKIGDTFDPQKLSRFDTNFDNCFSAKNKAVPDADYLIINDKVVKITISDAGIASATGVNVGDSLGEVYAKHKDQTPEIIDSPFSGPDDKLINMYYWSIEDGQRMGTRYDLKNDAVISISVGNDDGLMAQEGCA